MKDLIDEKNGLFGTNLAFKISPSWSLGQERKEGIFATVFLLLQI